MGTRFTARTSTVSAGLAHLLRQARGWAESTCRQSSQVGQQLLDLWGGLIQAARECPAEDLAEQQPPALAQLKAWCELHPHRPLAKLGEFCREMLNDWEAIVRPLLDPSLPLTHNAAERLLRYRVIARRLSFGTRSEQGTRAFALLASLIDTCRARKASAWDDLSAALQADRQGLPMLPLPALFGRGVIGFRRGGVNRYFKTGSATAALRTLRVRPSR
jgi:transposase